MVDPSSAAHTPAMIKHQCELKGTHAGITLDFHIVEPSPDEGVLATVTKIGRCRLLTLGFCS